MKTEIQSIIEASVTNGLGYEPIASQVGTNNSALELQLHLGKMEGKHEQVAELIYQNSDKDLFGHVNKFYDGGLIKKYRAELDQAFEKLFWKRLANRITELDERCRGDNWVLTTK